MAKKRKPGAAARKRAIADVTDQVMKALKKFDVYIYHAATSTGSTYLKFRRRGMRSVRISDHTGRDRYHYRYNVRLDHQGAPMRTTSSGWIQLYYSPRDIDQLVADVQAKWDALNREDGPPVNFDTSVPPWGSPTKEAAYGQQ